MKKRLSYVPAVIIVLVIVFLLSVGIVWLAEYISLPVWTSTIFLLVILVTVYEVMSRLGPEEFDPPLTQFLRLSGRDKVILLITLLAIIASHSILSQLRLSFRSGWMNLLFLGLGLLAARFIGSFFGSRELKDRNAKDRDQQES